MAREFTPQEQQEISRIREQLMSATAEQVDAGDTRRRLEMRLSEVQKQMSSPDGIASSQQFVDDVSLLRREIQDASGREQEADAARSRLSAQESQIIAAVGKRPAVPTGTVRTQRTASYATPQNISVATAARMKGGLDALRRAQVQYGRNSAARAALEETLANNIKKTAIIVFVSALLVAAVADVLSLIDAGWVISWIIPMIVWFMVRRVTNINKGGEAIVSAHRSAKRQLTLLQQRLRPALRSSGSVGLLVATRVDDLVFAGKSYVTTFARDTIITQLVELIPIVDVLPLYMGQVVKVLIDQNIAYQKVRKLMPNLRYVHEQIDRLEQFEIQYVARQIATVVRAQQAVVRQQRQAPRVQPQEVAAPSSLALGYAT